MAQVVHALGQSSQTLHYSSIVTEGKAMSNLQLIRVLNSVVHFVVESRAVSVPLRGSLVSAHLVPASGVLVQIKVHDHGHTTAGTIVDDGRAAGDEEDSSEDQGDRRHLWTGCLMLVGSKEDCTFDVAG